jgi:lipopolysaccharide/colanic/teichoic acid biosynthesis glycosyltransferase
MRQRCEYRVAGLVATGAMEDGDYCGYPVLGNIENLHHLIHEHQPEVIIVSQSLASSYGSDDQLLRARVFRNIRIEHAEDAYERLTGKLPIEFFPPGKVIYSDHFQPSALKVLASRVLSVVVAVVGLIVLAPLLLLIAVLIKLDSRGPVLFAQWRSGLGGRHFMLRKFRTMEDSGQQESEWEEDNAHRITRVGRWLRKFRLDELPQMLNILKGDMNLVGPRPHPVSNFELLVLASRNAPESGTPIPYYSIRSNIRPGITGWAQVRYRYANNLNEEMEKLRFDLYYLKHYSFWLDLRILFETVSIVLTGHKPDIEQHKPAFARADIQGAVDDGALLPSTEQASKHA